MTPECVRQTCQRSGADVHRRQAKKSGSTDTTAAWAKASLAQAEQMQVQLAAGGGDRSALRQCRREGWKTFKLEQVAFWDERHRKVILGCSSKYEWRFLVDKDHPDCRITDPNDARGILPEPMPITTAKYLSEARRSLGVALKKSGGPRSPWRIYTRVASTSSGIFAARERRTRATATTRGRSWATARS